VKYVFGPVSSRRFGVSLGIDLSPDKKRCNFDCVYCELEPSKVVDVYDLPPSVDDIVDEVKDAIKRYDFDVLTITSNGEPTLYPYLDELINKLRLLDKKLLILSNASTIYEKKIQESLKQLDIVKLSLDSVIERHFKKIDRPSKKVSLDNIIKGIISFRKIFTNQLIIEVLVVKGINDTKEDFITLNEILKKINPDRVDISTIDRPPAYNVKAVDIKKLFELSSYIDNQNIFIPTRENLIYKKEFLSEDDILNTLKKRPFSIFDVENLLSSESKNLFDKLYKEGKIKAKNISGIIFYGVN